MDDDEIEAIELRAAHELMSDEYRIEDFIFDYDYLDPDDGPF